MIFSVCILCIDDVTIVVGIGIVYFDQSTSSHFIRMYSLYKEIHCDSSEEAFIVHGLYCPYYLSPPTPSLSHLKQLQEVSSFYFIYVYESIKHSPSSSSPPFTLLPPTSFPPTSSPF
jgi:hypothetical protein